MTIEDNTMAFASEADGPEAAARQAEEERLQMEDPAKA